MCPLHHPTCISRQKGFTLIELTLYVSLMSMFLLALVLFLTAIFEARERQHIMAEVEQQGIQIILALTSTINKADSIDVPTLGQDVPSLTLTMYESLENPTIFSLDGSTLIMSIGASSATPLHNDKVSITALAFRNITPPDTPGSVQIVVTLASRPKPGGRTVFSYTKTFQTSLSLPRP